MKIHRKKANETIREIAESYGVSEDLTRRINDIENGECADGEELLILTPTRSYGAQHNDTAERIGLRFGIRSEDLYLRNPWIKTEGIKPGQQLALKYDEPRYGMALANGYFYKGCTAEKLSEVMPFLTYITFAGAVASEQGISRTADFSKEIKLAHSNRKIPLLRVHDRHINRYKSEAELPRFAEELIDIALADGYKGIVLDSCSLDGSAKEFVSFLMILRKLLIGNDLILITEINENSPIEFSEFADGSVMYYPKYAMENPPSFKDGERKLLSDFSCRGESAKTFIDLPSLAKRGRDFSTINNLLNIARKGKDSVTQNENTLLSSICNRKQGEYIFTSLSCIKELLNLVNEFDYMGISFDIMRTPLSHLMMYSSMFKTSYLAADIHRIRPQEGCSRASAE